jgi:hypothetical protein
MTRIDTTALREQASKEWGEDCEIPKTSLNAIADELDKLRKALENIASLETTLRDMCADQTVQPSILAMAGLRDAIRIAKRAQK